MLEINLPAFPHLTTQHLHLRRILIKDAENILFLRSDNRVMKYIERPRHNTIQDSLEWINNAYISYNNRQAINWGITLKDADTLIGIIAFVKIYKENYRAEVGYLLHPDHWGKGIISEALEAVIRYGFESLHFHSMEALVDPDNTASIAALIKQGFVQEAYFKENLFWEGKFYDTMVFSKRQ